MPEAARRRPSDDLDVRYFGSKPGDIALAGKLGLCPTIRVTILVLRVRGETKPFARLDLAPPPGEIMDPINGQPLVRWPGMLHGGGVGAQGDGTRAGLVPLLWTRITRTHVAANRSY